MANQLEQVTVRYAVDQASIDEAKRQAQGLSNAIASSRETLAGYGSVSQEALGLLSKNLGITTSEINQQIAASKALLAVTEEKARNDEAAFKASSARFKETAAQAKEAVGLAREASIAAKSGTFATADEANAARQLAQSRAAAAVSARLSANEAVKEYTALRNMAAASREALKAARDQERAFVKTATALEKAADANETFQRVSNDVSLAGDFQSNIGAFRGIATLSGATALGDTVGIIGEFVVLTEELPRLKVAMQGLPKVVETAADVLGTTSGGLIAGLGVAAIAFGTFSLVMQQFTAESEKAKKAAEDYRNALQTALGLGASDIDARTKAEEDNIARNRELLAILEDQRDNAPTQLGLMALDTASALDAIGSGVDLFLNGVEDFEFEPIIPPEVLDTTLSSDAINAQIDKVKEEIAISLLNIEANARAQNSASVAANTARIALEEFNKELADEFTRSVATALQAEKMTEEQRIDTVEANNREIEVLREYAALYEDNAEIQAQAAKRQAELIEANVILLGVTRSMADAEKELADAREAAKMRNEDMLNALKLEGEAREKLLDAQKDLLDFDEAFNRRMIEMTEETAEKLDEIDKKAKEDLAKVEEKDGEDRAKIAADGAKRRAKIEQDFADSAEDAVRARDYEAYQSAKKKRERELAESATDEKEALDELAASLQKQRKVIREGQEKQLQDAKDAANKAIRQAQDQYNRERADKQTAVNTALNDLRNAQTAEATVRKQHYNDQLTIQKQALANMTVEAFESGVRMVDAFKSGVQLGLFKNGTPTPPKTGGSFGGGALPSPLSVGFIPRARPEYQSPQPVMQSNGLTINIPVAAGVTRRDVLMAVDSRLDETLRLAGYE